MNEQLALTVECPICHVGPGEWCIWIAPPGLIESWIEEGLNVERETEQWQRRKELQLHRPREGKAYLESLPEDERKKYRSNQARKYKYGLLARELDAMFEHQGGRCLICEKELDRYGRNTHLDHAHGTGVVRGFLCAGCNTKLGWFEKNQLGAILHIARGIPPEVLAEFEKQVVE